MSLWTVFVIAVGVSADAFAVAISSGLKMRRLNYRHALVIAATFAGFQAVMPLLGWLLTAWCAALIAPMGHWVAFGLLTLIGIKMVNDALHDGVEDVLGGGRLRLGRVLALGVATSIDAAAVGVSLAALNTAIGAAIATIWATTFALSYAGVLIGHRMGSRFRRPAELVGGLILILIGLRILVDHVWVIA